MRDIVWYYPESLEETRKLLSREGTIPHGGGTGILRMSMRRVRGLIELSGLGLDYYRDRGKEIHIGATCTLSEVVRHANHESILYKALSRSASTPLRNRITAGGSVSLFPMWSDIAGPFIGLGAEVSLVGSREGRFSVEDYFTLPDLRKKTLITEVILQKEEWESCYYRETRTGFDYPAFTITVLLRRNKEVIDDMRIVLVGCWGKFRRFIDIEQQVRGLKVSAVDAHGLGRGVRVDFNSKKFMSGEYLKHIAGVQIGRTIAQVLG